MSKKVSYCFPKSEQKLMFSSKISKFNQQNFFLDFFIVLIIYNMIQHFRGNSIVLSEVHLPNGPQKV